MFRIWGIKEYQCVSILLDVEGLMIVFLLKIEIFLRFKRINCSGGKVDKGVNILGK